LFIVEFIEIGVGPRKWITLYNERAGCIIELIRVSSKNTCVVLAEGQRQSVEKLIRAVPDITIWSEIEPWTKLTLIMSSGGAVDSIGGD
jgi:hypothetical protein